MIRIPIRQFISGRKVEKVWNSVRHNPDLHKTIEKFTDGKYFYYNKCQKQSSKSILKQQNVSEVELDYRQCTSQCKQNSIEGILFRTTSLTLRKDGWCGCTGFSWFCRWFSRFCRWFRFLFNAIYHFLDASWRFKTRNQFKSLKNEKWDENYLWKNCHNLPSWKGSKGF